MVLARLQAVEGPLMGWVHDTIDRIRDQFAGRQADASPPRDPVEIALDDLKSSDWRDRKRAVQDLAAMSDSRVVPALISAMDDVEEWVRYEAAKGLGELKASEAVNALRTRLAKEQSLHVIGATAGALSNMADIPTLIAALDDPKMKWSAAAELGERQATEALDALAARLSDKELAYEIIMALRKIGDDRAVDPLLPFLDSPHLQLRNATAETLEAIGDKRAREAVAEWKGTAVSTGSDLRAVLIIFTEEFSPRETFVNSILDRMEARARPYRQWMTDDTPLAIRVNPDAQVPAAFLATATVEFSRALNERIDLEKVEYATFEGSEGISGVIVTLWKS